MASTLHWLCCDQYANSWNAKTMCACAEMKGRLTKTDRFAPSVKCHWFSGGCRLWSARLCDKTDTSALGLEVAWCHSLSLFSCHPWRMTVATAAVHPPHGNGYERSTIKKWMRHNQGGNVNGGFSGGRASNWRVMRQQFCLPALIGKWLVDRFPRKKVARKQPRVDVRFKDKVWNFCATGGTKRKCDNDIPPYLLWLIY